MQQHLQKMQLLLLLPKIQMQQLQMQKMQLLQQQVFLMLVATNAGPEGPLR